MTGASGFVGANLARRLLADGHEVHLLMRPGFRSWRLDRILNDFHLHEVILDDPDSVGQVVAEVRPEWIFHLATHGAYSTEKDLRQMLRTNVTGTTTLLTEALRFGFEAFVNAGSSSEYGFKDHAPSETESLEPNSDYAVTKASATLFCSYYGRMTGANIRTLRLYSAYGPWEEPIRFIPTLAMHGMAGRLPRLASPAIARDYVYVDDVVAAFILAAAHPQPDPGGVYNIGTGTQLTLAEVVRIARAQLAIEDAPRWGSLGARAWDADVWVSDSQLARHALGWRPKVAFEEGLGRFAAWIRSDDRTVDFYRNHAAR